jgi:hypothetical protein
MSFYSDVLAKSPLFRTTKAVNDLALLEPVTRAAVVAIIADAKAMGKDLRVLETYRSCERQAVLFQRKATRLKTVGCHHYGVAADLGLYVNGKYEGRAEPYRFLIELCAKHGLISGLDWGQPGKKNSFVDAGHVQRLAVKDQPRLFAGVFYPDPAYAPRPTLIASAK